MVTPLPPLDPMNDTPAAPHKEPVKCQSELQAKKWRVHPWAIVVVAGLCMLGVGMPARRPESLPRSVEPVASFNATPSLRFVVKPAALSPSPTHPTPPGGSAQIWESRPPIDTIPTCGLLSSVFPALCNVFTPGVS